MTRRKRTHHRQTQTTHRQSGSRRPPAPELASIRWLADRIVDTDEPPTIAEVIEQEHFGSHWAATLAAQCGSIDALETLTADPLPIEQFELDTVELAALDAEQVARVQELLSIIAEVAADRLDAEYRTIARRVVLRLASLPDSPLVGAAQARRKAAAIVWVALAGSGDVGRRRGHRWSTGDIWRWFGVSSCLDLGHRMSAALRSMRPDDLGPVPVPIRGVELLGAPDLLHSRHRTRLVDQRQELVATLRDTHEDRQRPITHLGNGQFEIRGALRTGACAFPVQSDGQGHIPIAFDNGTDLDVVVLPVEAAVALAASLQWALAVSDSSLN